MTYTTNIRLPDELGTKLTEYSVTSGIPRNTVVKRAVEAYLESLRAPKPLKGVLGAPEPVGAKRVQKAVSDVIDAPHYGPGADNLRPSGERAASKGLRRQSGTQVVQKKAETAQVPSAAELQRRVDAQLAQNAAKRAVAVQEVDDGPAWEDMSDEEQEAYLAQVNARIGVAPPESRDGGEHAADRRPW